MGENQGAPKVEGLSCRLSQIRKFKFKALPLTVANGDTEDPYQNSKINNYLLPEINTKLPPTVTHFLVLFEMICKATKLKSMDALHNQRHIISFKKNALLLNKEKCTLYMQYVI